MYNDAVYTENLKHFFDPRLEIMPCLSVTVPKRKAFALHNLRMENWNKVMLLWF